MGNISQQAGLEAEWLWEFLLLRFSDYKMGTNLPLCKAICIKSFNNTHNWGSTDHTFNGSEIMQTMEKILIEKRMFFIVVCSKIGNSNLASNKVK